MNWDGGEPEKLTNPVWLPLGDEPPPPLEDVPPSHSKTAVKDSDDDSYSPADYEVNPEKNTTATTTKSTTQKEDSGDEAGDNEAAFLSSIESSIADPAPPPPPPPPTKTAAQYIKDGDKVYLYVPPGYGDDAFGFGARYCKDMQAYFAQGDALEYLLDEYDVLDEPSKRVYLEVPFAQKDRAKSEFGCKWDWAKKQWFIHEQNAHTLKGKWIPGAQPKSGADPPYTRSNLTHFQVPFHKKDEAKGLGAHWDRAACLWAAKKGSEAETKMREAFELIPTPTFEVGKAPSNQSKCRFCGNVITKGSIRLTAVTYRNPVGGWVDYDAGWRTPGDGPPPIEWGEGYVHVECSYLYELSWVRNLKGQDDDVVELLEEAVRRSKG